MATLAEYLIALRDRGLPINTVYDIGAHKGTWSQETKAQTLTNSEFVLFEANPIHKPELESTGFKYFLGLLSNPEKGIALFYNNNGSTGDSYYKENSNLYDQVEPVLKPTYTIDQVITHNNLPLPDFIKIDTQGSELDILKGAKLAMSSASLVFTECPLVCYNKNAPTINDYLEFFRKHKMVPIGIFEIHYIDGVVVQADILFMKNSDKEKFISPDHNLKLKFK